MLISGEHADRERQWEHIIGQLREQLSEMQEAPVVWRR